MLYCSGIKTEILSQKPNYKNHRNVCRDGPMTPRGTTLISRNPSFSNLRAINMVEPLTLLILTCACAATSSSAPFKTLFVSRIVPINFQFQNYKVAFNEKVTINCDKRIHKLKRELQLPVINLLE